MDLNSNTIDLMKRERQFAAIMLMTCLVLLAGCGGRPTVNTHSEPNLSTSSVEKALLDQHQAWRGTKYRHGGLSRKGVDCSGFTYLTFRNVFGVALPRTAASQGEVGTPVKRSALRAGDLVLFKTGSSHHVGIFVNKDSFLHASTSKGVMISSLNSPYWSSQYWKGKRLPLKALR
jgi:probable lipoprotein NlpC